MPGKSAVFAVILLLSVQLALSAFEDPNPPVDEGCCSKEPVPEFTPLTAGIATLGVFIFAILLRRFMKA